MNKISLPQPEGVKHVYFQHWRVPFSRGVECKKGPAKWLLRYPVRKEIGKIEPSPRGGKTLCIMVLDNDQCIEGVANCSMADNFCYAVGRKIAYGRALKKLERLRSKEPPPPFLTPMEA